MKSQLPIDALMQAVRQNTLVKILEQFEAAFPDAHLKDLVVDRTGPGRVIEVGGRSVVNFGSDSFLGLDQDPRVLASIREGLVRWGTHNGASRAFASVRSNVDAEEKLAEWLGVEAVLIYPSVTLANHGAIPGLVGPEGRRRARRAGPQLDAGGRQDRARPTARRSPPSRTATRRGWRRR